MQKLKARLLFLFALLCVMLATSPASALEKNVANQGAYIYAFDSSGDPLEGDAANISCFISIDGLTSAPLTDSTPDEIGGGSYWVTFTQAETDGLHISLVCVSATTGAKVGATSWDTVTPMRGTDSEDMATSFTLTSNRLDRNADLIESERGAHTYQTKAVRNWFYVDPVNGASHASGARGGQSDPYASVQDCHDNAVIDSNHDIIFLVAGNPAGVTTLTEDVTLTKRYFFIRGPGRDFIWTRSGNGTTIEITADGVELSGFQLETAATGSGHGVQVTGADFLRVHNVWINDTRGDGINLLRSDNAQICHSVFEASGQTGVGEGIHITGTAGTSSDNVICSNTFSDVQGDAIKIEQGTTNHTHIRNNEIHTSAGWGINIGASSVDALVRDNTLFDNASGNIQDLGTQSGIFNNYDVVDGVWDEPLTGSSHNDPTSAGRRLRDVSSAVIDTFNALSGTTNTVTLDGSSDLAGSYDPASIRIDEGTGAGQTAVVMEYFGSAGGNGNPARTMVLREDWKTVPDATSVIIIVASDGRASTNQGQLRSGGLTTVTLNGLAPGADVSGQILHFTSGTGPDQIALIQSYSNQMAVFSALDVAVDATTGYELLPIGPATLEHILSDPQSAIDLKALVDLWYNPATNKGQGIVLTDVTTSHTQERGTDDAATSTSLAAVSAQTTRVDGLIEDSGGDRFTEKALEGAPSGTGSSPQAMWEYTSRTLTTPDDYKAVPIIR